MEIKNKTTSNIENREEQEQEQRARTTIKGFCWDCLFNRQEWVVVSEKPPKIVLDRYCGLCDIFKKKNGYCDCFETRD